MWQEMSLRTPDPLSVRLLSKNHTYVTTIPQATTHVTLECEVQHNIQITSVDARHLGVSLSEQWNTTWMGIVCSAAH